MKALIKRLTLGCGLIGALCLIGCETEQPKPTAAPKPEPAAVVKPVAAPVPPPVPLESIPTEEEFEAEAEKEITGFSLTQKLDALEKEIQAE